MRQRYWKPQHEVFVSCMLKHEDPTKAYCTAYPKANPASARVGGHRLYNYPHIRQRIQPIIEERRATSHKKALEEGAERERLQNERRIEMRRVLYKIVMRKLKRKRNFTVKGQTISIEDNPSVNTILNAMVLDLRLEAGYNNWPVIEARFARIMASLLPREKRVTTVINSSSNAIQATVPANSPRATLLQKICPIVPVISNEEERSGAKREISRAHAISFTAAPQEISPDGRNDALIFSESAEGCRSPLERGVRQPLRVSGVCSGSNNDLILVQKRVQSVTISPTNPAQTHIVRNLKKARITKAVTKTIWPLIREIQ